MGNPADREIDIRVFLARDRERIVHAIRKRSRIHLGPTEYFRASGERLHAWIDRKSDAVKAHATLLGGFVAKSIIGIAEDEIIVSECRGSLSTVKFVELPYEDLMKVSSYVARRFPAPPIESEPGMLAVGCHAESSI